MFRHNDLVIVPGKGGVQGRIASRREAQTFTTPALSVVQWIGGDGLEHVATFNDLELKLANDLLQGPKPPVTHDEPRARIVSVKRQRKPARKSKRK